MSSASNEEFSHRESFFDTDPILAISLTQQEQYQPSHIANMAEGTYYPHAPFLEQAAQLGLAHAPHIGEQSLETLLSDLFHPKPERRIQALHELEPWVQAARGKVTRAICYALQDESEYVRVAAAQLSAEMGNQVPISMLMIALGDSSWMVRASASIALGGLGQSTPLKDLIRVLKKDTDVSVREAVARTLGRNGHRASISALLAALRDQEPLVREAAAWSLGELKARDSIKPLLDCLRYERDSAVREAAARSLGKIQSIEAREALIQAVDDEDEQVRNSAVWAVQQIEREQDRLKAADRERIIADTTSGILLPEAESLEEVWPPEGMPELWKEINKQLRSQEAFKALRDFLKDKKGYVYRPKLFKVGNGLTFVLNYFYQNTGRSLQDACLNALKYSTAIKPVKEALHEQDEIIRNAAAQSIKIGKERPWNELAIISFMLSRTSQGTSVPLRIVLCGMGYPRVRASDHHVLNQFAMVWKDTWEEPFACERIQDLINLEIWYQSISTHHEISPIK